MIKYYFAAGQRIAMRKGGTLYYLTQDHLGGTALVTNASGAMVSRIRYFPYGGVRTIEGTNPPPTDKLFTGQQRETTNGVYHYKARLYNADFGRMAQADSIVPCSTLPQAYNRYAYVYNNPVNLTDPSGNIIALPRIYGPTNVLDEFTEKRCNFLGTNCWSARTSLVLAYYWDQYGSKSVSGCWVKTTRWWNNPFKVPNSDYWQVFAFATGGSGGFKPEHPSYYDNDGDGEPDRAKEDYWYYIEDCRGPWGRGCVSYGAKYKTNYAITTATLSKYFCP